MRFRHRQDKKRCIQALNSVFHAAHFRPGQEAAVATLLSGRDLLCMFPTGGGKSLCYQLPAVLMPRPVLVVSPLIALMRDQVRHLTDLGVPALCLDSMQTEQELAEGLLRVAQGSARLVYVSPERLFSPRFLAAISACPPGMVVVDEAHCVVSWGEEFRPAYGRIREFVATLPRRPVMCAMTATADERMQRQIIESLGMRRPRRIVLPLLRENLVYQVLHTFDAAATIAALRAGGEKTLVFCRTRRRAEALAARLCRMGLNAAYYHAGLEREERLVRQARFASGETPVLTATSAFGMGVDIPDIRLLVMDSMPEQMIDLAQQTGRAGRDGEPARVVLLLDPLSLMYRARQLHMQVIQVKSGLADRKKLAQAWQDERAVLRLYLGARCIPAQMARAFGQRVSPCGKCGPCLQGKGRTFVAAVPDLLHANDADMKQWALQQARRELMARGHLSPLGLTHFDITQALRTGELRCRGAWRGPAQRRMQALLDHMNSVKRDT